MSVYLGQDKIGVSYLTKANTYEDNRNIMSDSIYTPWVRPQGWPDLDSLNLEMSGTDSFIYMTYRTGHVEDICSFKINTVSGNATVEIGNISNGVFNANVFTHSMSNGGSFTIPFIPETGFSDGTVVIKITGRLSRFYLQDYTYEGRTIKYYMQPMLERIWYVPELISFNSGTTSSSNGNSTYSLQRDKINNGDGNALTSLYYAWWSCYNLQSLDISGLKTQNVTNMSCAFEFCRQLENLNIAHFNTAKVTTINYMFDGCYRIKELNLDNWDTQKLTSGGLTYAFRNCYALKQIIGIEKIYTNNLTSLAGVFQGCYSIEDLSKVKNWNTSKVTNFTSVFYNCYKIKTLNLSTWDVTKATSINAMFYSCRSLEHIDFPVGPTAILTGAQSSIFYWCTNLQEVDLSWIRPITSAVTNIGYMFCNCRTLTEINIPEGWDITGCVATESCYRIFSDCYSLKRITGISNWDMSKYNYSLAYSFQYNYSLEELDIKNWAPSPTSMYYAFVDCQSLKEIDLTGWHWENMTGNAVGSLFSSCTSLKKISGIEHMGDSGNLNTFASVFNNCQSLESIPNISSWDPAKVTTCATMFNECRSLKSLTITGWSLPKCTTIVNMFRYCYNMEELELTNWSLPALNTNPDYIFNNMHSLKKFSGLPITLNHRYQEMFQLPEDQWIRVFNQLPTVSNKTIYMTTVNINRLTAETKAIATNKGWSLVN